MQINVRDSYVNTGIYGLIRGAVHFNLTEVPNPEQILTQYLTGLIILPILPMELYPMVYVSKFSTLNTVYPWRGYNIKI